MQAGEIAEWSYKCFHNWDSEIPGSIPPNINQSWSVVCENKKDDGGGERKKEEEKEMEKDEWYEF